MIVSNCHYTQVTPKYLKPVGFDLGKKNLVYAIFVTPPMVIKQRRFFHRVLSTFERQTSKTVVPLMFLHKSGSRRYTLRGALFYRKLRAKNCLEEVQREAILFSLLVHRSHLNIILLKHVGLTEKRKKKSTGFRLMDIVGIIYLSSFLYYT